MPRLSSTSTRLLPLLGQYAFVRGSVGGRIGCGTDAAFGTKHESYPLQVQRPARSHEDDEWMHPGEAGV